MHFLDLLTEWLLFVVALPVTALCFILLADEFKEFKAARWCFWITALWTWGKVIMWGIHSPDRFLPRSIVVFVAVGIVGVGLVEVLRLTTRRDTLFARTEPTPPAHTTQSSTTTVAQTNDQPKGIKPHSHSQSKAQQLFLS